MPVLSDADAETVTDPLTFALCAGAVSKTVGGMVSEGVASDSVPI
jgi:hypothetical protein